MKTKSIILSSFDCKTCNLSNDRRTTSVSLSRKNWLHVQTACTRCGTKNRATILG